MYGIIILALGLITLTNGVSGCLTYIVTSTLIGIASYTLWQENGIIVAFIFSIGLAVYQVFIKRLLAE
jgi:hypothetical protein